MKNLPFAAATAVATLMAAAPFANAATPLTFTFSPDGNSAVASFNSSGVGTTFSDTYTFTLPAGFASTALTSAAENGMTDTAFTSVLLNGNILTTNSSGAIDSKSLLNVAVNPGANTLVVNGTSGGLYSYGGNVSFAKLVAQTQERCPTSPAAGAADDHLGFGCAGMPCSAVAASRRPPEAVKGPRPAPYSSASPSTKPGSHGLRPGFIRSER